MSTRANIGIQLSDGTIKTIYVHWDGYPSHTGKVLLEHYTDPEKVNALINMGNISWLGSCMDCPAGHSFEHPVDDVTVFFGRDRGDLRTSAKLRANVNEAKKQQYLYIFIGDTWFVTGYKFNMTPLSEIVALS